MMSVDIWISRLTESLGPIVGILVIIFLVILAVLWFLLPFAVFGINSKLHELNRQTKKANEILQSIQLKGAAMKNNPEP